MQDCSSEKTQWATKKLRQFNELRNKINKQNKYFIKDTEILKRSKKIAGPENSIKEMKNELINLGYRADQMEERICDIEDRNLEMIWKEGFENLKKNTMRTPSVRAI